MNLELEKKNTLCFYFDVRLGAEPIDKSKLLEWVKNNCEQYCYQLEKGEDSAYLHYQMRIKLRARNTPNKIYKSLLPIITKNHKGVYIAPTSNENKKNYFYVTKEDTRVEGPWSNLETKEENNDIYIPKRFRNFKEKMYPYQRHIWDMAEIEADDRTINILYSPDGCEGKSTISSFCHVMQKGIEIFPRNDAEKVLEDLCDILMKKNERDPKLIFIDLPRAMKKDKLFGLISAIEMIKKGYACDRRYEYKEWWFEPPHIWVFSNFLFDEKLLSKDRWKIYAINEDRELEKWTDEKETIRLWKEENKKKKLSYSDKKKILLSEESNSDDNNSIL